MHEKSNCVLPTATGNLYVDQFPAVVLDNRRGESEHTLSQPLSLVARFSSSGQLRSHDSDASNPKYSGTSDTKSGPWTEPTEDKENSACERVTQDRVSNPRKTHC